MTPGYLDKLASNTKALDVLNQNEKSLPGIEDQINALNDFKSKVFEDSFIGAKLNNLVRLLEKDKF